MPWVWAAATLWFRIRMSARTLTLLARNEHARLQIWWAAEQMNRKFKKLDNSSVPVNAAPAPRKSPRRGIMSHPGVRIPLLSLTTRTAPPVKPAGENQQHSGSHELRPRRLGRS